MKQGGSILAILIGVGLLFAASTDNIGNAINALRGKSTTTPEPKTESPPVTDETDTLAAGGGPMRGMTNSMRYIGQMKPAQTGSVRLA